MRSCKQSKSEFPSPIRTIVSIILLIIIVSYCVGQDFRSDPYTILAKYFNLGSQMNDLDSNYIIYTEDATSFADGSNMSFSSTKANNNGMYISEVYYGDNKDDIAYNGYDGNVEWEYSDGKLSFFDDKETINNRILDSLKESGEHLNKDSDIFNLSYKGMKSVDNNVCYRIEVKNSINNTREIEYIDSANYYLRRHDKITEYAELNIYYYDYKKVTNILYPFRQIMIVLPQNDTIISETITFEIREIQDDSLFHIPERFKSLID